jgi:putative endopeptidase
MSGVSVQICRRPSRVRRVAVGGAAAAAIAVLAASHATRASASTSTHGVDITGVERSVTPGADFFRYANGGWLARTDIPPDRSSWSVFSEVAEQTARRTQELLEAAARSSAPAGSAERQAGDYYATYLDERAIETAGTRPLQPMLARIDAIHDKTGLARVLGEDLRADVDPLNNTDFHTDRLFGLWVSPDLHEPARNAPYLLQGGLDLPDREYYLGESPEMNAIRTKYVAHVAATLRLAARPDADVAARGVVDLETRMARVHATRLESLEVRSADNPWKRTEFATRAPGLDWTVFFAAAGLGEAPVIVAWHARAIAGLSALVASEPLETWKNWLAFHAIDRRAGTLPPSFMNEWFAFHGRTLSGTPQLAERWKRAVSATNAALGDAVGQVYVKHHFSPDTKAEVQALVANVVAAFGKRIDRLDWMSPATKARAQEKLSTLYVGVGYPEHWTDYSGLEVVRGDAFGNAERAEVFEYRRRLAQLRAPADKTEWWMTPQTVNAVNLPLQNALNFPAAILQPPSFDPAAPAAVNYGNIGATIGHEISHSFDDQGALFDANGRLANWWSPEDLARFEAAGAKLAAQYDQYAPFPDLHVNGRQTLSENIADLAGLAAAYDAWQASLGGALPPAVNGFTGEQQFFISYAQSWRSKDRPEALRQQIITDGHAPDEYRADTVRNLDAWYEPFAVAPGQRLFLAPPDRVRVW